MIKTVKAHGFKKGYIRPLFFLGNESLKLDPHATSVHCAIMVMPWRKYVGHPLRVTVSPIRRLSRKALHIEKKIAGHYINSIVAQKKAQSRGYDDALMLDDDEQIAEGSVANVFFVLDGVLVTPPVGSTLPGITRDSVIKLARDLGIAVNERMLKVGDIEKATEAFFTGTAVEIAPIKSIDNKAFDSYGPDSVTMRISKAYESVVHSEDERYSSWLTVVE